MRISRKNSNYFYFSLDDDDFRQYGYDHCRRFMNKMKKEIPGGRGGQRYWLKEMKCWAIKNESRPVLDRLLNEYFKISQQKEII